MPEENSKSACDPNEFDLEAVAQALTEQRSTGSGHLAEFELESELASVKEVLKLIEKTRRPADDTRLSPGIKRFPTIRCPMTSKGYRVGASVSLDEIQRIGRFEIIEQLGQGGYGLVFLAYDTELDRQVALKVPRPESIMTVELRTRFLREGKAAGLLNHPNIVPVFEVGRAGAVCYLVSRYVDGIPLSAWMANQDAACEADTAAAMVAKLADAVQHAHSRGVIHRDLKPANVILESVSLDDTAIRRGCARRFHANYGLWFGQNSC